MLISCSYLSDSTHNCITVTTYSDGYAETRGAAYGLAGLVKGLGILSLKQLDIMSTLKNCLKQTTNQKSKEGMTHVLKIDIIEAKICV